MSKNASHTRTQQAKANIYIDHIHSNRMHIAGAIYVRLTFYVWFSLTRNTDQQTMWYTVFNLVYREQLTPLGLAHR